MRGAFPPGVAGVALRRPSDPRGVRMRRKELPVVEPGGGLLDATGALRAAESRGETVDQVLDRNLIELLQELRVAFTGVQILFGFLLSLSFTQRFPGLDGFQLAVYTTAL